MYLDLDNFKAYNDVYGFIKGDEIIKFTNGLDKTIIRVEGLEPVIFISTLEGYMKASVGDYIIRGLRGEYYPCKPDIFHKKYEPCE